MLNDVNLLYGLPASGLAAVTSLAGVLAVSRHSRWAERNSAYISAFAVGLLSVGVLFHLIPEALEASVMALSWVAGGFAIMVLVGIAVQASVDQRVDGAALTFGYASIIALAFHSFIDGVIYAAAFRADEAFTGWITVSGLLLHEFPEGVIAYFLLNRAGLSTRRSIALAAAAASATTVLGALASNLLLAYAASPPISSMLGAAAGALIYVLIVHLGPHAANAPKRRGYAAAQFGVFVGVAAVALHAYGGGH